MAFIRQALGKVLDSVCFIQLPRFNIFIENLLHNPEFYLSKSHTLDAMYTFGSDF